MNRFRKQVSNSSFPFSGSCAHLCQKLLNRIQSSKNELLAEFRPSMSPHDHMLQLSLNEAEALAHETGFPLLVFPTLGREKAEKVSAWKVRQQTLRSNLQLSFAA